jgi:hypothetical protein
MMWSWLPLAALFSSFFFCDVGTNLQWTSFRTRLRLNTNSRRSLTLLHIAGKDRGKSLINDGCLKRRKWPVCLLKGADKGKLAYNSIGGKV